MWGSEPTSSIVRVIVNMISAKLGWSGGQRRPPGLVGTKEELTVSILIPHGGRQIDWGSDRAHFVLLVPMFAIAPYP